MHAPRRKRQEVGRIGLVLALFGLVVLGSYWHGTPVPLPDVALGWALLLHVERALVLVGAMGAVVLVGWRAMRGDLPIRVGQIEYEAEKALTEAQAVEATHERRLRIVEALLGIRSPRVPGERAESVGGTE